jgi:bifunctional DNase/RNase
MIEMSIESIRVSLMNYQRVVILKEKGAERYLPIWIGPAEAEAIAVRLQEVSVARPLTHDLLRSIIDALGAQLNYILVNDLANDTFYARIYLDVSGRAIEIDSRPSDAIALAVRANVPIFAEESVLDRAGVMLDKDEEKAMEGAPLDPEELEKMSAFRDFIEQLDLDDFEKRKPSS